MNTIGFFPACVLEHHSSMGYFPTSAGLDVLSLIQFACLDSSIAMKTVINKYKSIILTSGTITPLEYIRNIEFQNRFNSFIPNVF
ncbi:hypothetical protein PFDG_05195 [Plasmodium falciparum Dd2]|uniref:Uncharacterized protein n=1 Tax=Plasmodium falciparum (isolate Dd2) TaxID=57267 RepID=A0A0L7MAL2_PLAF4|nr:hypothetical protein PFDG_05195 [Plasmodium falciparum Dd2]